MKKILIMLMLLSTIIFAKGALTNNALYKLKMFDSNKDSSAFQVTYTDTVHYVKTLSN